MQQQKQLVLTASSMALTVLRDGTYIDTCVVAQTTRDQLVSLMVGRELDQYYVRDHVDSDEVVMRCEHISDGKKLHSRVKDVSFELYKGEILGFAGLVGAGRSETMQCIFGLTKGSKGEIELEGLYHVQSVRFNSTIEFLHEFISHLHVNSAREAESTVPDAWAERSSVF